MKKSMRPLFFTQFYGVLNDNLLKGLICFIAVYWLGEENRSNIIAIASAVMVLPFLLFSPIAGWMAQRYPKRSILQVAKLAEIPIMLLAILGFFVKDLPTVLIAMFFMALQSALYSPSKYGLIKDLSDDDDLARNVGTMEMLSFVAILVGTLIAGIFADTVRWQMIVLSLGLMIPAVLGYLSSLKIGDRGVGKKEEHQVYKWPITFIWASWKTAGTFKGVRAAIIGLGSFWLVGSLIQIGLLMHCPEHYGMNSAETGLATTVLAIGIGLGCWVAGRVTRNGTEIGMVTLACTGFTISLFILAIPGLPLWLFLVVLFLSSFFGGLFKVPLDAWIQQRSSKERIGEMLALSNMVVFLFFLISAGLTALLQPYIGSNGIFLFAACIAAITGMVCFYRLPAATVRCILWLLAHSLYRLRIEGMHHISRDKGAILVCNHVSLLDALLVVASVPRNTRFVMHEQVYHHRWMHWFFKSLHMIPVAGNKSKEELLKFTLRCKEQLDKNHMVCLFTEGQISRSGHLLEFKKGIEHLMSMAQAPVILLHLGNVVGSPLSYRTGTSRTYGFDHKTLRRRVYLQVSPPLSQLTTAFQLRQKMKELEVQNFRRMVEEQGEDLESAWYKALALVNVGRMELDLRERPVLNDLSLHHLVMNTPDHEIRDITGRSVKLVGTLQDSIGRPLPGVAIKVVDKNGNEMDEDQPGMITYLCAYLDQLQWVSTRYWGKIDKAGFVRLVQICEFEPHMNFTL